MTPTPKESLKLRVRVSISITNMIFEDCDYFSLVNIGRLASRLNNYPTKKRENFSLADSRLQALV